MLPSEMCKGINPSRKDALQWKAAKAIVNGDDARTVRLLARSHNKQKDALVMEQLIRAADREFAEAMAELACEEENPSLELTESTEKMDGHPHDVEKEIVNKVYNKATCPKCGDSVFISRIKQLDPPHYGDDPEVMCRDMGHWIGRLSECDKKE